MDEAKPVREKVLEELKEELGIKEDKILSMSFGEFHEIKDKNINKTWLVCPVLVELNENVEIILDWEHTEYKWVMKDEINKFDIVPELDKSLEKALERIDL